MYHRGHGDVDMVIIRTHGMGYLKVDSSSHQFLQAGEAFLRSRSTLSSPSSSQCLSQKHVNIITVTVIVIAIIYKLISLVLIFLRGALDAALIFASEEESVVSLSSNPIILTAVLATSIG